jgi:hypothetical protein
MPKSIWENVATILRTIKSTRDNDAILVRKYWEKYGDASPESITRYRRAIQTENEELRGKTYTARKAKAGHIYLSLNAR